MITKFEGKFETTGPRETEDLAVQLSATLKGGEVLGLVGELGAGKTTFIRGLARGLEVNDPLAVKSPSYTLVLDHPGPRPLLHLDAYFMKSGNDLELCGMEDALGADYVVAIEWADRVAGHLPQTMITITMVLTGPEKRMISIFHGPFQVEKKNEPA